MYAESKYLTRLSRHHADFTKDQCHKISRSIIDYCIKHQAGTLVLGENRLWKQNSSIGSQNNQNFISMPTALLKQLIIYKASGAGIRVIMQEESYTSKADITAMDYIPVYGIDDDKAAFSGLRISRGCTAVQTVWSSMQTAMVLPISCVKHYLTHGTVQLISLSLHHLKCMDSTN